MDRHRPRLGLLLAGALAALTFAVYAPVRGFLFLNYDDNVYVTDNARIAAGLSSDNLAWSLTAFENGNWHPLTLVSHMADIDAFGLSPAGHHTMNLVLHVANVLFLFWLLSAATSRPWPSAFVAALFAVHPLNVQTVAWISERKSLLSTLFWLLALLSHVDYRRCPRRGGYLRTLGLAALALASKPMAVTLPLTLVLLDTWPLVARPGGRGSTVSRYARELAPFLALSAACGVLTLLAQRSAHALQTAASYPWPVRLANAVVAYAWYLKTLVWPAGLAAFYPHPVTTLAAGEVAASALALLALGAVCVVAGRKRPEVAFGALWYAGTLLPVVGLVQVGSQAYADRYAYVPLVGVFVAAVWPAAGFAASRPVAWRRGAAVLGAAWLAALALTTRAQLPYWHDSLALFRRAIEVVPDNALAHNNLGMALVEQNRIAEATDHFARSAELAPWDSDSRSNLGNALRLLGKPVEAEAAYLQALRLSPDDATIQYNLATALVDLGRTQDALSCLNEAVRLEPDYTKARLLLGTMLYRQGRSSEALEQFREVARRHPDDLRATEAMRRLEGESAR